MREIEAEKITQQIREMCMLANYDLPEDVEQCLRASRAAEPWPEARDTLDRILENVAIAREERMPLCQDTGMACVFLELGQEVHIVGGDLTAAVYRGVEEGYEQGYLRKSVVGDPLRRVNTGNNLPALLHTDIVPGDRLGITVAPKGFGSENMSQLKMCRPSDGVEGVVDFVVETVRIAGPNPCPPVVVGVGIGGSFDHVALLAKRALLRPLSSSNPDPFYRQLEDELLVKINELSIGPQGLGGKTTALKVSIKTLPTHIAGLPVAVNICCHVNRHMEAVL